MKDTDPLIDTGRGKMLASEAMGYLRSEIERVPTTSEPRDTSVLLGILRALPIHLQNIAAHWVIRDFMARPSLFDFETARILVRESRMIAYTPFDEEPSEIISFGSLSRTEMGQQCQYGSRYVHGRIKGYPNLAEGLRVSGDDDNYHSLCMHVDDVPTFLERYRAYVEARMRR